MKEPKTTMSLKVTVETRRIVEQLAAKMTLRLGKRHTLTDVVTAGILLLAKVEGKE